MFKSRYVKLFIFISIILGFSACGDKKDDKTGNNQLDSTISSLITKDETTGKDKVQLRYIVRKGDIFRYKIVAKTSTSEKSPATEDKEVKQDNEINYYYTKEVQEVEQSGIVSFKVKYDSILINAKMDDKDIIYNSNINDSIKQNPAFIQYNAVINESFYIRVTPEGEITDVYGLEKIYENLFKALGDTLKEEDKQTVRDAFGKESIREILQQEYQIFPKNPIQIDSSWVKSYSTQVLFFEVLNSAKYTLTYLENKDNQRIADITALLQVEFLNKEVKEKGVKFKLENTETSGTGKIKFNFSRGCITNKETSTALKLELNMSAGGQSAKSLQSVQTNLVVSLLN